MSEMSSSSVHTPTWYRIVSVLAVIWMAFGVIAWVMDFVTDETTIDTLSEAQRTLYAARPAWMFALYGVAILSGFAGAVALLLRKAWAVHAFALSLAAAVIQFAYTFVVMDAIGLLKHVAINLPRIRLR